MAQARATILHPNFFCLRCTLAQPSHLAVAEPEMAPQTKVDRSFGGLTPTLSEWVLEAVDTMGFAKTTPVQHAAIPMFMKNSDVVVEAVTGSGKTLAYVWCSLLGLLC